MDPLDEMNKSARSVRVSIHNTTAKKLVLKSHPLISGQWKVQPPDVIVPMSTIEFGSESTNILGGTEAGSIYGFEGGNDDGVFEFFWNNPYFGKRGFRRLPPIGYECDLKDFGQNNATLRFTIKEIDNGYLREVEDLEKDIKTLSTVINETDGAIKGMDKMKQVYQSQKDLKQATLVENNVKEKTKLLEELRLKRESLQNEITKIKQLESDPKFMEQNLNKLRENIDKTVRDRKAMEHMREVYEKQKDVNSIQGLDKQIEVKKKETDTLRKKEQKVIQKVIELKKQMGIGGTGVVLPAKKRVEALYQYEKSSEDEISISPGDIIEVIHDDNGEWLGGQLNGQAGYFPRSFVKFLEDEPVAAFGAPAESAQQDAAGGVATEQDFADLYPKARVIFDHTAADEGELNLKVGDTIAVYAWEDDYWWEGFIGSKSGYFPCNNVEWIEPEHDDTAIHSGTYSYYETTGESVPEEHTQTPAPTPVVVAPPTPAPTPVVVAPTPAPTPTPTPAPAKVLPKRELPSAPAQKPAVVHHTPAPAAPTSAPTPAPVAPVHHTPVVHHTPTPATVAPVHHTPTPTPAVSTPVVQQQPTPDTKKSPAVSTPTASSPTLSSASTPVSTAGFDKLLQPIIQELTKQLVDAHQKETQALQQRIAQLEKEVKELRESKGSPSIPSSKPAGTVTSFATVVSKAAPVVKKLFSLIG
ncbi:hypothetical protein PPL_00390 [Heterostelium album PN500]|uniref:SH3 domain-containing protein n=1 Tax=Heterostelium pallidum (strain ATCC 26659 / Pp 5 / PN500) TaxID=670386 RepID=D3AWB6_HETP5|nr:hypothetical protein PPL_00390 [Heterostelium album PN500]EFA86589.1 hypothetical protein PPL_00390 [Heterostelium album PN500]|eukprot:XP_020438694.1 hypothetical protein PPL_00390 [Heterostelium album PN500]